MHTALLADTSDLRVQSADVCTLFPVNANRLLTTDLHQLSQRVFTAWCYSTAQYVLPRQSCLETLSNGITHNFIHFTIPAVAWTRKIHKHRLTSIIRRHRNIKNNNRGRFSLSLLQKFSMHLCNIILCKLRNYCKWHSFTVDVVYLK